MGWCIKEMNVYWRLHHMGNTDISMLHMGVPCYIMVSKHSSNYSSYFFIDWNLANKFMGGGVVHLFQFFWCSKPQIQAPTNWSFCWKWQKLCPKVKSDFFFILSLTFMALVFVHWVHIHCLTFKSQSCNKIGNSHTVCTVVSWVDCYS